MLPALEEALHTYKSWALSRHLRVAMIGLTKESPKIPVQDLYVPLAIQASSRSGISSSTPNLDIEDILKSTQPHEATVIMGEAGSGKTTVLRKGFQVLLQNVPYVVPVFARLAQLRPFLHDLEAEAEEDNKAETSEENQSRAWAYGPLGQLVKQALKETPEDLYENLISENIPLILLLDGLDELTVPGWRLQALGYISSAINQDPNLRVVLSCRHSARGHDITFPQRFKRLSVNPLNDHQRKLLMKRWFSVINESEDRIEAITQKLGPTSLLQPHLRTLVSTPLFSGLLCALHLAGKTIPQDAISFLRQSLELLLDRHEIYQYEKKPVSGTNLIRLLQHAAVYIQEQRRQDGLPRHEWSGILRKAISKELKSIDQNAWNTWLQPHLSANRSIEMALTHWLEKDAQVLTELDTDILIFAHRGFQEMLCASRLTSSATGLQKLAKEADAQTWREPFLYACQMLNDDEKLGILLTALVSRPDWQNLQGLLDDISYLLPSLSPKHFLGQFRQCTPQAQKAILTLFGAHAEPLYRKELGNLAVNAESNTLRTHARHLLRSGGENIKLSAFEEPKFFGLLTRRYKADNLVQSIGLEETYRKIIDGKVKAKDAYKQQIPAEEALSYLLHKKDTAMIDPTTGIRFLEVSGPNRDVFWLAETPVTNEQFKNFARETQIEPTHWRDRRFNHPEQPVVGVTWHQAHEFCHWLQARLDATLRKVGELTLPSAEQWNYCAFGEDKLEHPWGDKPIDNTVAAVGLESPLPAGSYPHARGPFGHLDLIGNIAEWCSDQDTDGQVPQLGGSFLSEAETIEHRVTGAPDISRNDLGFRLCLVSTHNILLGDQQAISSQLSQSHLDHDTYPQVAPKSLYEQGRHQLD